MEVPSTAFAGAEGRYEDWVFLYMLEQEWKRTLTEGDLLLNVSEADRPSPRAVIAIIFWTYFETKIERLLRQAMRDFQSSVIEDLLNRYSAIGARLERLYRILFNTTYWADLIDAGFEEVAVILKGVHVARNSFVHGTPSAIDDHVITEIISFLRTEHESWIAVFNRRATRIRTAP